MRWSHVVALSDGHQMVFCGLICPRKRNSEPEKEK